MENRRVVVYIPFNNLNVMGKINEALTWEWINKRISIFMNYTLKSLKNQTNQNFTAYVVYHSESNSLIKRALSEYPPLPANIHFISDSGYEEAIKKGIEGYKYLYEVHLHSDDMYHRSFIEQIHNYGPKDETVVLICQNGYIYDSMSGRLAKYFNFSSSFNCFVYKAEDYLTGQRYVLQSYMGAIRLPHEILEKPNYINHCHDNNVVFSFALESKRKAVMDVWNYNKGARALFGEEITDESEKRRILEEFTGG